MNAYAANFNPMMQGLQSLQGQYRYEHENNLRQQQAEEQKRQFDMQMAARQAQGGPSYGKSAMLFKNADGQSQAIQFASDGTYKTHSLPGTPFRGTSTVDTATGTQIVDKATGHAVRNVDKNLARAEEKKIIGREQGDFIANYPKYKASVETFNVETQNVLRKIKEAKNQVNNYSAGFGYDVSETLPFIGHLTGSIDLGADIETIKSNVFTSVLQAMRDASTNGASGLGQVTEKEIRLIQSKFEALDQNQSPEKLKRAFDYLYSYLAGVATRMNRRYNESDKRHQFLTKAGRLAPQPSQNVAPPVAAAQPQQSQPARPQQQSSPLDMARDAIARGAPREAVIARLKQNGIDTTGL